MTEEIHLNCIDKSSIRPGTTVTKLSRFLDKVITRQFYTDTRRSSVSNNVVITSPPFIYYQIRLRDDYNEFNIMLDEDGIPVIIDFP